MHHIKKLFFKRHVFQHSKDCYLKNVVSWSGNILLSVKILIFFFVYYFFRIVGSFVKPTIAELILELLIYILCIYFLLPTVKKMFVL